MATKREDVVAELERLTDPETLTETTALPRPKLFVPLGRGNTGKTVLLRWVAERANNAGCFPAIADADRTNQTLSSYFDGVISPESADDLDMKEWLDALLEKQIESKMTVLLDLGGGDLVLKQHAAEMELVHFMHKHGVDVVAAHLIGPNLDDLAYLQSVEQGGTFAPERTILVLNEGLISGARSERGAFEPIVQHRIFRDVVARGAKVVRMPRLGCLHEVENRRLSFAAAEAGQTKRELPPLGLTNRQRVAIWLRDMNAAFEPVADWLP